MKTKRQTKMLELIKKHDIETQEELSDYLQKEGYQVFFGMLLCLWIWRRIFW